jgi:hypothetical protein
VLPEGLGWSVMIYLGNYPLLDLTC